jgi:hypothetical protein
MTGPPAAPSLACAIRVRPDDTNSWLAEKIGVVATQRHLHAAQR